MSPRPLFLAAACLLASTAACGYRSFDHVDSAFHASANARSQYMPVTEAAREYDSSDAKALVAAGGVYLGEIELRGVRHGRGNHEGPRSDVMLKRAAREAAAVGATHFMLVRDDAHTDTERQSGMAIGSRGPMWVSTTSEQQVVVGHYALVRIEPAKVASLPAPLRPVLL